MAEIVAQPRCLLGRPHAFGIHRHAVGRAALTAMRRRPGWLSTSARKGRLGIGGQYGSPDAGPLVASSRAALSRTERVTAWAALTPLQPSPTSGPMGLRARVGLRPNSPQLAAGMRIDPPPSLPCAIGTMPAATAAAAPPLEPPGLR